jgi:glycosyltransferase involved in cell wall biosynthesis
MYYNVAMFLFILKEEKSERKMSMHNKILSIVIPCYNEENNIVTLVNKVLESPIENKEIIIVDDCSKDGTRKILEEQIKPLVSKIIYHTTNGGKGAALRTGFQAATGDVVIIQDADLEYDPMEYPKVVNPIFAGKAKVVYGSRFLGQKRKGYFANRLANWGLTAFSNLFTHQKLTDMETCYKAFRRDVIQSIDIKENRFGFEPEITAKISKKRIRIHEVPISYYPRSNEEGKKIGFKDGFRALYVIWRYR